MNIKKSLKKDERFKRFWLVIYYLYFMVSLFLVSACSSQPTPHLTVSAAANLIPAFEEIAQVFEAETGVKVVYNFASSGSLAQQITQGAPVDVFASANRVYVSQLFEAGLIVPDSFKNYALGRLVMWSGHPSLLPKTVDALTLSGVQRIAIANPDHAPYGIVAKNVLQNNQLWDTLQPKIVIGGDVRQTLTYAETGNVSVALVPLSLVVNLETGAYQLIPDDMHPPITQSLGIVNSSPHQAEATLFV